MIFKLIKIVVFFPQNHSTMQRCAETHQTSFLEFMHLTHDEFTSAYKHIHSSIIWDHKDEARSSIRKRVSVTNIKHLKFLSQSLTYDTCSTSSVHILFWVNIPHTNWSGRTTYNVAIADTKCKMKKETANEVERDNDGLNVEEH